MTWGPAEKYFFICLASRKEHDSRLVIFGSASEDDTSLVIFGLASVCTMGDLDASTLSLLFQHWEKKQRCGFKQIHWECGGWSPSCVTSQSVFKSWGKLTVTPQKIVAGWFGCGFFSVQSREVAFSPLVEFFYVVQSVPCPFHKSHHRWNCIEEAMTSMLLRYNSQGY